MSLHPRPVALLAASALLLPGLTGLPAQAAPADAADAADGTGGSAPVTVDDRLRVMEGTADTVDVLANDTDADGDDLAVCRLGKVPRALEVLPSPDGGELGVFVRSGRSGTYSVTYYACDFERLTPGTLTIVVEKAKPVKVAVTKIPDRPGRLKVVNRSGFPVRMMWGARQEDRPDGSVRVAARPVVVEVQRRSLIWVAASPRTPAYADGVVRGIRLPPGTRELPPGAPRGDAVFRPAQPWG